MNQTDRRWLANCYKWAWLNSDDPNTKNGAAIVTSESSAIGANQMPFGVSETAERLIAPKKYAYMIHAEANAIATAASLGIKTFGATLYCPWAACADCAKLIINAGIAKVIVHRQALDLTPERWRETIKTAAEMFDEAMVRYIILDGNVYSECASIINGTVWNP